jgi:HK97 gp10 family phage protein
MSVQVEGLDDLLSRFDSMVNNLSQEIGNALLDIADTIVSNAQGSAPVDTGELRDDISIVDSSDTSITITSGAGYSGFVEYGTRYMSAQPFFEPAINQAQGQIGPIISDAVSNALQ